MDTNSFGAFLKNARTKKKMSTRKLASKCGISGAYVSNLENSKRATPSLDLLLKLSAALDVTYEELMYHAGYLREADEVYKEMIAQFRKAIEESKVIDISNLSQYKFSLNGNVIEFPDAELAAQLIQMLATRLQSSKDAQRPKDSH